MEAMKQNALDNFRESLSKQFETKETEFLKERLKIEKSELAPSLQPKLPINLPPSLTITTKSNQKELHNPSLDSPTSAEHFNPANIPFNLQGKGPQVLHSCYNSPPAMPGIELMQIYWLIFPGSPTTGDYQQPRTTITANVVRESCDGRSHAAIPHLANYHHLQHPTSFSWLPWSSVFCRPDAASPGPAVPGAAAEHVPDEPHDVRGAECSSSPDSRISGGYIVM